MFIRPKLFLAFLGICLIPLLLLALVNYWYGLRNAEASFRADQEARLAGFKNRVDQVVSEERNELINLSRSPALLNYLTQVNPANTTATQPQPTKTETSRNSIASPETLSSELKLRLATVLNAQSPLSSISLFDWNKRPLLAVELRANADSPIVFQTRDFRSEQSQPDQRLWTTPGTTQLNSSGKSTPSGGQMILTVAVLAANSDSSTPQGALVGNVKLDQVFSEAAAEAAQSPARSIAYDSKRDRGAFIVLDRSGRILYHRNEALKHRQANEGMPYFQPAAERMLSNQDGQQLFSGTEGDEHLAIYSQISPLDVSVALASNHDGALADARRAGRIGLFLSLALGLLAAALLTRYWQHSARGIERVTEGVVAIAGGKLDHRIEARSSDDIRVIAEKVNLMTEKMRDQIAREAETRQFQSFVRLSAILTHDLKNAIEALSLTVSNMERHFDDHEFRADAMKTLSTATQNLRAVVARLSNPVSTLSGEHKRPSPVDMVPMLKRVISMTAKLASEQHEIKIDLPPSLFALVDGERMSKVMENLIINALEAMDEKHGTLTIRAGQTEDGKPFFSITDTGQGMSPRFIEEKLFRPFATTRKKGVGLGLYTCREVVQANGGSIDVESRQGAGTTFRVVLPSAALDERGYEQPPSQSHS